MSAAKNKENSSKALEIETLKVSVMEMLVGDDYEQAIESLKRYVEQPSEYHEFKPKMERLGNHCVDLINAIRAKKNFPGMKNLTRSKQQELGEKILNHFNELQLTLVKMERVMNQLRREDIRSTVWIIRAIVYATSTILIVAFLREVTGGFWGVFETVMANTFDKSIDWVFSLF